MRLSELRSELSIVPGFELGGLGIGLGLVVAGRIEPGEGFEICDFSSAGTAASSAADEADDSFAAEAEAAVSIAAAVAGCERIQGFC